MLTSSSLSTSLTLNARCFFSSFRSSFCDVSSFTFCCNFSTSEDLPVLYLFTESMFASLRNSISLFSFSTLSHRFFSVSISCFKLSICSWNYTKNICYYYEKQIIEDLEDSQVRVNKDSSAYVCWYNVHKKPDQDRANMPIIRTSARYVLAKFLKQLPRFTHFTFMRKTSLE